VIIIIQIPMSRHRKRKHAVIDPGREKPMTEVARLSGFHVRTIGRLMREGVLPRGRKVGTSRYLPCPESLDILSRRLRRRLPQTKQ
jgi:hypothetical protein